MDTTKASRGRVFLAGLPQSVLPETCKQGRALPRALEETKLTGQKGRPCWWDAMSAKDISTLVLLLFVLLVVFFSGSAPVGS